MEKDEGLKEEYQSNTPDIPLARLNPDSVVKAEKLRQELLKAVSQNDFPFIKQLLDQVGKIKGEHLAKIINSASEDSAVLALVLDLLSDQDMEDYLDFLPDTKE